MRLTGLAGSMAIALLLTGRMAGATANVTIEEIVVRPDTTSGTFSCQVTLTNQTAQSRRVRLDGAFAAGNPGAKWSYPALPVTTATLTENQTLTLSLGPVKWTPGRASWWWPNAPYRADYRANLHQLSLRLYEAAAKVPVSQKSVRFGFCTPGQKDSSYLLNGVRIHLRGDTMVFPDGRTTLPAPVEPPLSPAQMAKEITARQRLGLNALALKGPVPPGMLSLCDERGMLVLPEALSLHDSEKQPLDNLTVQGMSRLRVQMREYRSHPSVFKWTLLSASTVPEPLIRSLVELCRKLDPVRPCAIDTAANVENIEAAAFSVIETSATTDLSGPTSRSDRPYGLVRASGAERSAEQTTRMAMLVRSLRLRDCADIRIGSLATDCPEALGLPIPKKKPQSLLFPRLTPVGMPQVTLMGTAFSPLAVYDPDYDRQTALSNAFGHWPAALSSLPSGKKVERTLVVLNDELSSAHVTLSISATLFDQSAKVILQRSEPVVIAAGGRVRRQIVLPLPAVKTNTGLRVALSLRRDGKAVFQTMHFFVVTPGGPEGATAQFLGKEVKTGGDWAGKYGKQGFLLPVKLGRVIYVSPGVDLMRGTGFREQSHSDKSILDMDASPADQQQLLSLAPGETTQDRRVATRGPGLNERSPAAFVGEDPILFFRAATTDGKLHRLSLYLLDFARQGQHTDIDIFDLQGHPLASLPASDYGEGAYYQFAIRGTVVVRLTPRGFERATLSGMFVDPE